MRKGEVSLSLLRNEAAEMARGMVVMSERELQRVEVLSQVADGTSSVTMAAGVLGMSVRQVQRLLRRFRTEGAAAIRHKARGRRSNNRIRDGIRDYALTLIRESYADFGPTLAAEKLAERHGLVGSRETVRKWMIADSLKSIGSSAPGVRSKRMLLRIMVSPGGRQPARKPIRLNLASVAALLKMTADRWAKSGSRKSPAGMPCLPVRLVIGVPCQRRRKSRPWRRCKTRPVGEDVRHGARASHIAGACHGALARQGQ